MCKKCDESTEWHTCPYKSEINDNFEECSCCNDCEQNCSDEI